MRQPAEFFLSREMFFRWSVPLILAVFLHYIVFAVYREINTVTVKPLTDNIPDMSFYMLALPEQKPHKPRLPQKAEKERKAEKTIPPKPHKKQRLQNKTILIQKKAEKKAQKLQKQENKQSEKNLQDQAEYISQSVESVKPKTELTDLRVHSSLAGPVSQSVVPAEKQPPVTQQAMSAGIEDLKHYEHMLQTRIQSHLIYPKSAQKRRMEGLVVLAFTLNRQGKLLDLNLVQPSQYHILDKAALRTLNQSAPFPPFFKNMKQKQKRFIIPIEFKGMH